MDTETRKNPLKKSKKVSLDKKKGVKELTKKKKISKEVKTAKGFKKLSIAPFEETTVQPSKAGKGVKPKKLSTASFQETSIAPSDVSKGVKQLPKKKVNRRHRKPTKLKKENLNKKSKKKIFNSVEAAEKSLQKKVENLKELRAKRKNKLFVVCKKKVTDELQIKALHPDIKSVKFPRKKNPKYCWIAFATLRKANEAFETLKDNQEYLIQKPKTNVNVDIKSKAKELYEKTQKKIRKKAMLKKWSKAN